MHAAASGGMGSPPVEATAPAAAAAEDAPEATGGDGCTYAFSLPTWIERDDPYGFESSGNIVYSPVEGESGESSSPAGAAVQLGVDATVDTESGYGGVHQHTNVRMAIPGRSSRAGVTVNVSVTVSGAGLAAADNQGRGGKVPSPVVPAAVSAAAASKPPGKMSSKTTRPAAGLVVRLNECNR